MTFFLDIGAQENIFELHLISKTTAILSFVDAVPKSIRHLNLRFF